VKVARMLLIGAAALMVPATLLHADTKIIPGSACVRIDGNWLDVEYGSGRARSLTSDPVTLICPVIRHYPTSASIDDGRVSVTDATSGTAISCTLRCCSTSGTGCDAFTDLATDGAGDQYCYFEEVDAQTDGPCTVSCTLHDVNDRLRLYEYTE